VLEIGRANRPDIYNLRFRKQPPFVPRHLRFEVPERMNYKGEVVTPLESDAVAELAGRLKAEGVEAVAVSFLHSYANPGHEETAAAVLRSHLPGVKVTTASGLTREWREYERTSTAVLNAFVQPVATAYLRSLTRDLRDAGMGAPLFGMKSNGGTQTFAVLEDQPIHLVESGPVGGVIGAAAVGKAIGIPNLITLDIGGTTAKCALQDDGLVKVTTEYRIERDQHHAGYPIKVPVVDIVEIGAGGGSIAWIDDGGALKIGPKSAGAVPGPACYGNGGTEPTVTDANLIAGRINPDYFLGGEIPVSIELARQATEPIAAALGVTVDEAALGIIRLANANMINALKLVSVRRGYDPRDYAMIAFGGGGAMHAAALATELHVGTVIVPPAPAHFSAWGMLMTDPMQDFIQTALTSAKPENQERIASIFVDMEAEARQFFANAGYDGGQVTTERYGDMRYHGQEHTVQVPFPADPVDVDAVNEAFHALHERTYTFRLEPPTEIVNFHLVARVAIPKPSLTGTAAIGSGHPKGRRLVNFDESGRLETTIYERADLIPGEPVEGPAVIEEPASTTVIHPGQRVMVDSIGNLRIETGA
jgi:N-methylhydantoinase A